MGGQRTQQQHYCMTNKNASVLKMSIILMLGSLVTATYVSLFLGSNKEDKADMSTTISPRLSIHP